MSGKKRNKGGTNKQLGTPVQELKEIDVCYWNNPVHSGKLGLMTGRVTKEQAAWYDSVTPDGVSYKDATLSYDPIEKRKKEARKKFENRER